MLYSTYVDASETYNLITIEDSQVEAHCNRYMDSMTGLVFHESEKTHQYDLMMDATTNQLGLALSVMCNDIEIGYMYVVPIGKRRHNLVCLVSTTPQSKALLVHALYSLGTILRYTPRCPDCSEHALLFQPASYMMHQDNRVECIKLHLNYNHQLKLDQLGLKEV